MPRVPHRVERRASVCRDAARLPVVQAPGQLADDEHVGAGEHLGLEGTGRLEAGPEPRGPQVREEPELAADRQQRRLRPPRGVAVVERGIADGAEQDGVGAPRGGERLVGQRRQAAPQRRAADRRFLEIELMPVAGRDDAEDGRSRGHDFRTDAVAGQQENRCFHVGSGIRDQGSGIR